MSGSTWENVYSQQFDVMERTRLTDGWIYRNRLVTGAQAQNIGDYVWQVSSTYVPDAVAPPPLARQARAREDTERAS